MTNNVTSSNKICLKESRFWSYGKYIELGELSSRVIRYVGPRGDWDILVSFEVRWDPMR